MFTSNEDLLSFAARYIPGGVTSGRRRTKPTVCIARAKGAYVEDVAGRRYIDYHAGAGTIILGYCDEGVDREVASALQSASTFGIGVTEAEAQLAKVIVDTIPSAERALFCNSGSEATLNAIRLARAVTRRPKLIKFQGSYHGFHDYVLMNNQSEPRGMGGKDPHSAGMLEAAVEATIVCTYNDLESVEGAFRAAPDEVAAIIVEPVAHNAPGIVPKPGFLQGLRKLADREGALLIFDEVITGFRHHIGGFQSICGVMPDLTTMGKAIANGYPIAVLAGAARHMERFNTSPDGDVVWAGTYNGSAVGVTAALATIHRLLDGSVHRHIDSLGGRMRQGLARIGEDLSIPVFAAGYGSLFALLFMDGPLEDYRDVLRNDVALFERYRRELISRGVLEMPDHKSTRSHISGSHTVDDIDRTLAIAAEAMRDAVRSDSRSPGR